MNEIKLSIIIPFYNAEKYIAECLQSIYNQDIPETDYEVICVNDGSFDDSRANVLEFQYAHKNLILLDHKINKLLPSAKNTGLRAAHGKYVWFIDSDDFIKNNVFGKLLEIAEKNELEIMEFNSQHYIDGKLRDNYYYSDTDSGVITGFDCLNFKEVSTYTWSKIFLKEFLLRNSLFFVEDIVYNFDDQVHSLASLLAVKRYKFISEKIYFYRIHSNSIMAKFKFIVSGQKWAAIVCYICICMNLLDKHSEKDFFE
ncbi:MAG: glycosyltransferase, partial [Prevotellaceae bacterium]|nr:glycosyltransferase [Prevotellaceae bacterium]